MIVRPVKWFKTFDYSATDTDRYYIIGVTIEDGQAISVDVIAEGVQEEAAIEIVRSHNESLDYGGTGYGRKP